MQPQLHTTQIIDGESTAKSQDVICPTTTTTTSATSAAPHRGDGGPATRAAAPQPVPVALPAPGRAFAPGLRARPRHRRFEVHLVRQKLLQISRGGARGEEGGRRAPRAGGHEGTAGENN